MEPTPIHHARAEETGALIQTIVLAFAGDPMARWCWPGASEYLSGMPQFVAVHAAAALKDHTAHRTADGRGAALWMPPGAHPDEAAMGQVAEDTVRREILGDLFGVMEAMAGFHPAEPHWYLPMIGVDPAGQGQGQGSALLQHALARCDREQLPAYLESSNPRNISLYERHGFRALGVIQVGTSPQLVPMLRTPR